MPSALRVRLGHVLQVIVSRVPRSSLHSYSMILSTVQLPLFRKLTISNGPNSDKASRIFYLSFDHWRERTDGEREMICRVTSIQGFWNRASVPWIEVSHHVFFVDRVDVLEFSIASPPIENNFSFHVPDFFTSSSPLLINRSLHWPDEISPRKFFGKQQWRNWNTCRYDSLYLIFKASGSHFCAPKISSLSQLSCSSLTEFNS